jgi:hypothetical protein
LYQKFKIFKIQDGGRLHLGFTKMLITFARIAFFGRNLNWIYPVTAEFGKCHQNDKILKIQDGRRHQFGFTKMLLASARVKPFLSFSTAYT